MLHQAFFTLLMCQAEVVLEPPPPPPPAPSSILRIEKREKPQKNPAKPKPSSTNTTASAPARIYELEPLCVELSQITYSCSSIAFTPAECQKSYRGWQTQCAEQFQAMMSCISDAGFMCEGEQYRSVNKCDASIQALQECSAALPITAIKESNVTETTQQNAKKGKRQFIKGNIVHLGTRELVSRYDHISIRAGPRIISKDFYLTVAPSGALYTESVALAFHVPLNLLVYRGASLQTSFENQALEFGGFSIRGQDWDELSDFARIIRFITYGRKESPVYFTITSLRPSTLGHGQLVHNYQPNLDVDRSMTGMVFDAYNDWGGFQFQMNDITFNNRMIGALAFVKPLGLFDSSNVSPILRSLSIGVEYAADFKAPRCIQLSSTDNRCVQGSGHAAGPDPYTGEGRDNTFVRTDPELGQPVVSYTDVQAYGLSSELKFYRSDSVDLKAYVTWHQFAGAGDGYAGGVLSRLTLGEKWLSGIRARTEFRTFSSGFRPNYWDTLYEISKFQTIQTVSQFQIAPTKYQNTFGDPENGFVLQDQGRSNGYNLEFSLGLFKNSRRNKKVAIGLGLTGSDAGNDTNFYGHIELPLFKYVQLFGSFIRLNAANVDEVFSDNLDNVIALAGARLQILPFLFMNLNYARSFQNIRRPGAEFHLGNENVVDRFGEPSTLFTQDRIYEASHVLSMELELGLEFKE
ncbi:MAG: hypothetical protein VYC39_19235 [Myxococcota bacterium]|nr:hypothetical protein [Myxococcota bacterium]